MTFNHSFTMLQYKLEVKKKQAVLKRFSHVAFVVVVCFTWVYRLRLKPNLASPVQVCVACIETSPLPDCVLLLEGRNAVVYILQCPVHNSCMCLMHEWDLCCVLSLTQFFKNIHLSIILRSLWPVFWYWSQTLLWGKSLL